ncbi:MAG: hypothetical protein ACLS59_06870 [Clostridia bacterium]
MNEKEIKAVEILNTFEFRGKTRNYKEISSEDSKSVKIVLNLLEKLQKENEKYKQFFDLMLRLDSDYFINCGDKKTIKLVDEIEKLESE